jgi:hypothetical protein
VTSQFDEESLDSPNYRRTSLRGRGAARQLRAQEQAAPLKPVLLDRTPDFDFSQESMRQREEKTRVIEGERLRIARQKQADPMQYVPGKSTAPEVVQAVQNRFDRELDNLVKQSQYRVRERNLSEFPMLQDLLAEAREYGAGINERDVENLISWGQLNAAVDSYVKAAESGNPVEMNNIVATLSAEDGNIFMASMFPTLVEERLKAIAETALTDPSSVEKGLELAGGVLSRGLEILFTPADKINEAQRASRYYDQNTDLNEVQRFLGAGALGVFNEEARRQTNTPGNYNKSYLSQLVTVGGYSEREVGLAEEIARRFAIGEDNPIISVWNEQDDLLDSGVASFFYSLMGNADTEENRRIQDLMRQVQSVDMGNNGAMWLGAADPNLEYSTDRATRWFEYTKGAMDITTQVASDPLLFLGPAVRAAQVAKWQLGRLLPGAERAVDVLKPRVVAGVEIHTRASRYFDNFVKDLNRLDGIEAAARQATGKKQARLRDKADVFRQRMSGRYNNLPDDLVETFRKSVPKDENGVRTLQTFAQYVDDANDAWRVSFNQYSSEALASGATDLASRSVARNLAENSSKFEDFLVKKFVEENPTIVGKIASQTKRRNVLVPQMSVVGRLRSNAVNRMILNMMPSGQAAKVIDNFFGSAQTPEEIAAVIEGRYVELARSKPSILTPGGVADRVTRLGSSLTNRVVFNLTDSSSAKEFYRYTRQFLDRGTSAFLTDAFREANQATRRALVISVVRSSAASRGVFLKPNEMDDFIARTTGAPFGPEELRITGVRPGEAYEAIIEGQMPSDALGQFRRQKAAMARAATPEGEQLRMSRVAPEGAEFVTLPRVASKELKDELARVRSASDAAEFIENDPRFAKLFDEIDELSRSKKADALEVQAAHQRFNDEYAAAAERFNRLKRIADIEDGIKEIEDTLPAFTTSQSGGRIWIQSDKDFKDAVELYIPRVKEELASTEFAIGDTEIREIGSLIDIMSGPTGKPINLPPQWMSVYEKTGQIPLWWVEKAWNSTIGASRTSNILRQWLRTGKTELREGDAVELRFGLAELRNEAKPYVNAKGKTTKTKVIELPWKAERGDDAIRLRAEAMVEDEWLSQATPMFDMLYDDLLRFREEYARVSASLSDDVIRENAAERVASNLPLLRDPVDPLAAVADDIANAQTRTPWSPSRDRYGVEHAMHEYQIADSIRVPTPRDLDQIRMANRLRSRMGGGVNEFIGRVVDAWSWGTLFGPRFSMRNAIEEVGIYFLTGGRFMDLYRGRKADQAMREIQPIWQVKEVDGKLELIGKSNLGMVASRSRKLGTKMEQAAERANQEWFADIVLPGIDKDRLIQANIAFQAGDVNAYVDLMTETLMKLDRGRLGLTALSDRQKRAMSSLARSQHGQVLADEVAAGGGAILSGRYPHLARTAIDVGAVEPGVVEEILGRLPLAGPALRFGEYGAISPRAVSPSGSMFGNWFWFRGLQARVDGDGPIGKLAVLHLGDPAKAKEAIFKAVKDDTSWGYKERWTRLVNASDDDIRDFANGYYESTLRLFQKKNGDINWDLRGKFIDKDANGNTIVAWRKTRKDMDVPLPQIGDDEYVLRVNSRYLASLKEDDIPEVVFGRELALEGTVPTPTTIEALFSAMETVINGGYGWMGRQNARISRAPIFKANYFNMVDQMVPFEKSVAKALADGGTPSSLQKKLAETLTDTIAMDSAYSMTLAYVDNPANRSALAWKARNVARYYRATEDFYRRAGRLAKFYPDAYYRAALTYSLLDTTGFVYTDDNGSKYFAYPGNEIVQDVIANIANPFFGLPFMGTQRVDPFFLGGKVLGQSPSLDPKMLAPSMMGPMTVPLVAVFEMFPNLSGLKAALLGPYSAVGTGNLLDDIKNAALPAGAKRLLAALDEDELDTVLGQAAVDTVKIYVANGIIEQNGETVNDFMQSDAFAEAQSIAVGLTLTKLVMGWLAPGAPQVYDNTVSNIARRMGITSMDGAFRKMLEARMESGDEDAWNTATSMWYAAKIPGSQLNQQYSPWNSLMPFTISGTKQADTIPAGANVLPYDTVYDWFEKGEGKRLLGLKGGVDAAPWLAPREGEFTWQAWNLVKNVRGYRVSKTTAEGLESIFAAEGKFREMEIRKYYNSEVENLDPNNPQQAERIKELNKEKDFYIRNNERTNPTWAKVKTVERAEDNQAVLRERLTSMETLLESMESENIKITGPALRIQNAITIWRTFSPMISGLGNSRADKAAKDSLRAQMEAALLEEASESVNAENFINSVINPLAYGSLRDPIEVE